MAELCQALTTDLEVPAGAKSYTTSTKRSARFDASFSTRPPARGRNSCTSVNKSVSKESEVSLDVVSLSIQCGVYQGEVPLFIVIIQLHIGVSFPPPALPCLDNQA